MVDPVHKLRSLLTPLLQSAPAAGLLFSGGLRSSLLAALGQGDPAGAVAVSADGRGKDEPFVPRAAQALGLSLFWARPDPATLADLLPQTVKILRTFDPVLLRPALAVHVGILLAKEFHLGALWSGEASYLAGGDDGAMTAAEKLGHALGVVVHTPFRHPAVRSWWDGLSAGEKSWEFGGRTWDQAPLRRLAQELLPEEIAFRDPCPPEAGAGTGALIPYLFQKVGDADFLRGARAAREEDGVDLKDKEHFFCYRLYRSFFGPPPRVPA